MKFFRKKSAPSTKVRSNPSGSDSKSNFYSHHAGEAPLDEYSDFRGVQKTSRTSMHSAGHRRESNNRASSWAIAFLLLRAVFIVLLLVGGFIVLKLVLERMSDPSEKERQQWDVNALRMEKMAGSTAPSDIPSVSKEFVISAALIEQRLKRWEQTGQLFRAAEALTLRGINEEAAQRLEQALRIAPDNLAAQQLLADIYMQLGRYTEAAPLYIRLLDQDGPKPELQMNLLRALHESGQIDAGLILADRILLDQPNNKTVLLIAATGQLRQGNTDAALAMSERILENDAQNTGALETCGKLYFSRSDYAKAISYYLELVRLDSRPDYYQMLARSYAQQDLAEKTVVFLGQAASLFGSSTIAPWLKDPLYDPVRETVEFRSFADRIVGVESRKTIEAMTKRAVEKASPMSDGLELPKQPELLRRKK